MRDTPGGKGPCFDHAHEAGKRKGMTEVTGSNHPGRPWPVVADDEPLVVSPVKVQQLQWALWAAAKQSKGRRFHALFDRVYRGDVLWEAWERVRTNRGAAGVDRVTLVAVEDYGVDRMLRELRRDLREGRGRWGYPRCETGWPRRRPRSCWNPSLRRIFCRARMDFGRSGRRRWPRNACVPGSLRITDSEIAECCEGETVAIAFKFVAAHAFVFAEDHMRELVRHEKYDLILGGMRSELEGMVVAWAGDRESRRSQRAVQTDDVGEHKLEKVLGVL